MSGCASPVVIAGNDTWAPSTYSVDNTTSVQVAHANARRRSILVMNDAASSSAVHILNKSTGSIKVGGRSYPLAVGEGVTISTTAEVFVIADSGTAVVKVIEEFGTNG